MIKFKKIEDYGIIGNLDTCALVSNEGSIDWCCFPHIESPSVFASILDLEKGGRFSVSPAAVFESSHRYIEGTNILETEFIVDGSKATLTDFMPLKGWDRDNDISHQAIYRKVRVDKGRIEFEIEFSPAFDYARSNTELIMEKGGIKAIAGDEAIILNTVIPLEIEEKKAIGRFALKAGEEAWLVLLYGHTAPLDVNACQTLLRRTTDFWLEWSHSCEIEKCFFEGPWHDLVIRSGLVLKLLTHHQTGAVSAAPTASLPEEIGGERNWDYRYNWIRDASFTVQALFNLGHISEAIMHLDWFLSICTGEKEPANIRIMYGLHGEVSRGEEILHHLSGYLRSKPVRIGNDAVNQVQHDIYGELIRAIYDVIRYKKEVPENVWSFVKRIVEHVVSVWETEDAGIWEIRGERKHYVYSKLMCWIALDRAIKIADYLGVDDVIERWKAEKDKIKETVIDRGFDDGLNSFVQSFGSKNLDSTNLLIPLLEFLPADDPMVKGTIDATLKYLATDDGFVYRYNGDDGLKGKEGAFILCSFWLVDALALSGRIEEAEEIFLKVIKHTGSLGLLAEEIDPDSKAHLGNYPQAFSHIGLINSAIYLGRAKGKMQMGPLPVGEQKINRLSTRPSN